MNTDIKTGININSNAIIPSSFSSLRQLLDGKEIELTELIQLLTPLAPESIGSLKDLAERFRYPLECTEDELKNIQHLIHNLIFKQFSHPIADSVKEVISNAIDAQARSKLMEENLSIIFNADRLEIVDKGDGIGFEMLVNYFVPGRSSNPSAIFSLNKGLEGVTGRFGQGGLSIFYYLLYHTLASQSSIPRFCKTKQGWEIKIPYTLEGKAFEATFSQNQASKEIHIETREIHRKITVDSTRNQKRLKLKFFEKNGRVQLDIQEKPGSSSSSGTRFKIVSPLVNASSLEIQESIQNNFGFVLSPPILINNQRVNHQQSGNDQIIAAQKISENTNVCISENLKEIRFDWGAIYFSSMLQQDQVGSLLICEGGKKVQQITLDEDFVPLQMVVNFHRLPLTHDRAVVNFKDSDMVKNLKDAISTILKSDTLNFEDKSCVLNALYPILTEDRLNLIRDLKMSLQGFNYNLLPALAELGSSNLKNSLMLNPEYLMHLRVPSFYQSGNLIYHWIEANLQEPLVLCQLEYTKHIFVDSRLNHPTSRALTLFNMTLLNKWMEQRKIIGKIPLDHIFEATNIHYSQTTSSHHRQTSSADESSQSQPSQALEEENDTFVNDRDQYYSFVQQLHSESAQNYPDETRQRTLKILSPENKFIFRTQTVRYLYHTLCQNPNLALLGEVEDCLRIYSLVDLKHDLVKEIIERIVSVIKNSPEELSLYRQYLKGLLKAPYDMRFQAWIHPFETYSEHYLRWKKLVLSIDSADPINGANCIPNFAQNMFTDLHVELILKIPFIEVRKNLLRNLFRLHDVNYLLNLPDNEFDKLTLFFSLISIHDQGLFNSMLFNKYVYDDLIYIVNDCLKNNSLNHCRLFQLYLRLQSSYLFNFSFNFLFNKNDFLNSLTIFKGFSDDNLVLTCLNELNDSLDDIIRLNNKLATCIQNEIFKRRVQNLPGPLVFGNMINLQDGPINLQNGPLHIPSPEETKDLCECALACADHMDNPSLATKMAAREKYLALLEKNSCLQPRTRSIIYAALSLGNDEFKTCNYVYPQDIAKALPLHQDPDVLAYIHNEKLALSRIQSATLQSHKPFSWIKEVVKNSLEAGADQLDVEVHLTPDKEIAIILKDNGQGMGSKELKALKTPGYTTKRTLDLDPNFGWGFFTLFHEFNSVYVSTYKDGLVSRLLFEKMGEGITLQQATSDDNIGKGTTLILKKGVSDPSREIIQMKSEFTNCCQSLKNVEVHFQSYPIAGSSIAQVVSEYSEPWMEEGQDKGEIKFILNKTKEGVYWKDLGLGAIPEDCFSLVPHELEELMQKDRARFCIYLPHLDQNMTRNQSINDSSLTKALQRGVLRGAIYNGINHCLKDPKHFKLLSEDFWNDFRVNYQVSDPDVQHMIKALNSNDWTKLLDTQMMDSKNCLLDKVQEFFKPIEESSSLSLSFNSTSRSSVEMIQGIKAVDRASNLDSLNTFIQETLSNSRSLAQVMIHLPVLPNEPTLATLRQGFVDILKKLNLINSTGEWTENLQNLDLQETLKQINEHVEDLKDDLNLDPVIDGVLQHFVYACAKTIGNIQTQKHLCIPMPDKSYEKLAAILKAIAKDLLNKEIKIKFYDEADNRNAYTFRGSNTIYINKRSLTVIYLSMLLGKADQNSAGKIEFGVKDIEQIASLMETLCHELTHQDENTGCESTHDQVFRTKLSHKLESLLVKDNLEKNALQILGACNE